MVDLTLPNPVQGPAGSSILDQMSSLGSMGKTEEKKQSVAATSQAKKIALADEQTLRTYAAAEVNDNRLAEDPVYQDLRTLPYGELVLKYGPEVANNRARVLEEESKLRSDLAENRTDAEVIKDTTVGVTQGAFNLVGSIAALGVGAFNDQAGAAVSQFVDKATEDFNLSKSDRFNTYNEANQLMGALDQADRQAEYQEGLQDPNASPILEAMKYWGKSAGDAVSRVATDPALAGDFLAQNIGSIVPSVGLAKGAQVVTKGTKLKSLAVPAAVALGESGAAYTGAVNRVMEMKPEELMASSPDYRALIEGGMSHEEAQVEIATDAGMLAAVVQAPLAAAAGKVVEKFEVSPMTNGGFKESMAEIGKQVLEEGFQEGTGQFNQNLGIQTFADENQALMEGVPEGAALGGLGGGGVAGVMKTPGLATDATKAAVKGVIDGTVGLVNNRAAKVEAATDAASPVGQNAAVKAAETAQSKITETLQKIETDTTVDATAAPVVDYTARVKRAQDLSQSDIDAMPDTLRNLVFPDGITLAEGDAVARLGITSGMIQVAQDQGFDPQTRKDAALWLKEQADLFEAAKDADVSALPKAAQEEHQQMLQQLDVLRSNPIFKGAEELAPKLEMKDLGTLPEITDENVQTPEVRQVVGRVVQLAHANPTAIDPAYGRVILNQVATGKLPMEARVQERLQAAIEVAEIFQEQEAAKQALAGGLVAENAGPSLGAVKAMILSDGKKNDLGQYGLKEHVGRILSTARAGNLGQTKALMDNLRNFAEHMQNKVAAANESMSRKPGEDNKVSYRTWTGSNWVEAGAEGSGKLYVNPRSKNSMATGQAIQTDADTVLEIYNTLARGLSSVIQTETVDAVDPNQALLTERSKERRLRKDAVVKTSESLIEQEPKNQATTPVVEPQRTVTPKRPAEIRKEQAVQDEPQKEVVVEEPQAAPVEYQAPDGSLFTASPMDPADEAAFMTKLATTLDDTLENGSRLMNEVLFWETHDVDGFGGFTVFEDRTVIMQNNTLQKFLKGNDRMSQHVVLHELAHVLDASMHMDLYGEEGQISHTNIWSLPATSVGKEVSQILSDPKHMFHSFLKRYAATLEGTDQQQEVFAELLALFLKNPERFKEVAPNVHRFFERRLEDVYGVSAKTAEPETDTRQLGDVSVADGQGASPVNGPVPEEAAQEAETAPEEEAGQGRRDADRADQADQPSSAEETGEVGTEDAGTEPADATASDGAGRVTNPFTNLVKSTKGVVRFVRAYTIDETKSPLITSGSPTESVLDALRNFEANRSDLFLDYEPDEEQKEALASLVQTEVKDMVDALNAQLLVKQKTMSSDDGESLSPLEALAYGSKDFTSIKVSRSLNLVDENTGEYDATLIQTAALAALHWVLNSKPAKVPDSEEVAKMFSVDESEVTSEMIDASRNAVSGSLAVESLGREIMEFWGAKANGKAPMSDTLGIAQGLASDLLSVMRGRLTVETTLDLERDGKKVQAKAIRTSHPNTDERAKKLSYARGFLKEAFVKQEEKPYYFDQPPAKVRSKQKRNPIGKLGSKMQKAMRRHQEQKFVRNTSFVSLMQAIGQEAWMDLMGFQKVIPELMNVEHLLSVEGKNTQLQKSWEGVMEHNMRQEAHARANGKNADDVVTHFDVYAVSNERIHQDGFNPQSNKTMREAFVSTEANLDLNKAEHRSLFWLTVAQSSGLIKTELVYEDPAEADSTDKHARTAAKTEAMVEAKFADAIEILIPFVRGGELDGAAFVSAVKKAGGGNEKLIHSLLAVAKYKVAMSSNEEGARKNFRHFLSLEADGKTDGPMAALVNHSRGLFSVEEIRNFRRGGFFLGSRDRTLNDQFQNNKADVDLYQIAAKGADGFLKAKIEEMMTKGGGDHAAAMMRFLAHFSEDFSWNAETGELTIKRGLLKNPLTVTVYGSGANGIADKISGALLEAFYERLTDLEMLREERGDKSLGFAALPGMEDYADLLKDVHTLVTQKVLFNKKTGEYFTADTTSKGKKAPLKMAQPRDFKLSPQNREMLSHNIRQILVNPMRQGIGQVMANPQEVNKLLQLATQIQSQAMMGHFRKAVKETLDAKRATGELEKGEFLSQDDYNEIYRKMSRFGAVIEPVDSNENHLNLSGGETVKSSYEFTRSLTGEYSEATRLPEPSDAGVAASAMMTISRGDAMMMVNYFASEDPDLRVLAVFDGLEMPADGINEISEKINKAVAQAWMDDNGPMDLADTFADFTRQGSEGPFAGLDEKTLEKIAKIMELESYDVKGLTQAVTYLSGELKQVAREIQARKNVMKSMEYSMDHMASGRTPYNNEGEVFDADPSDADYDQKLVDWLNFRYEEELRKLTDERKDQLDQPSVEPENDAFKALVEKHGVEMGYRPITRMTTRALMKMLRSAKVSKDAEDIFKVIQKALPDFTFLFGSPEELTAYRNETYPEMQDLDPIEKGQTDMTNRVVYVANQSAETVLHETIHTATMGLVLNRDQLDDVQQAALENLERLMTQFMDMDFSRTLRRDLDQDDGSVLNVAQVLQRQIADALARGDEMGRAIALNEFMAWSLSNQNLIDVMRKTKVRTPLRDLVFKATAWMRKLLGLAPTQKLDMFSNILTNTAGLIRGESRIMGPGREVGLPAGLVMHQMTRQPVDARLANLMERFQTKIESHLQTMAPLLKPSEELKTKEMANHAADLFKFHGFDMDAQQTSAFKRIQVALASSMQMDNRALVQAQRVFSHVMKQLSPKDFEGYPDGNLRSQERFNVLTGEYGWETDLDKRSNLLASFLALSQVDPAFRRVLDGIDMPKDRSVSYASMDDFLTSVANSSLDTLGTVISSGGLKSKSTREALDRLSLALSEIEKDDRLWIEKKAQGFIDQADNVGAKFLSTTGERLSAWADKKSLEAVGQVRSRTKELIRGTASVIGATLNEARGSAYASAAVSLVNRTKVPTVLKELLGEFIGMTAENEGVLGLVNRVKAGVSAMRQDYREEVPKLIAEKFSRELTDEEWSALHLVYGKTDSGVLEGAYGKQAQRRMLTDKRYLENEITQREDALKQSSKAWATQVRKAKELARFMVTGEVQNNNLLRNATAIAALMGEGAKGTDDPGVIEQIDILTTLYALEMVDQGSHDLVAKLADTEADGIDFLSGYLWSIRADELGKIQSDAAKFNHYKGYIPSQRKDGISLIVADDSEYQKLIGQGYTRMGDYQGAGVESGKKGYYFSTVAGNGTYTQGVLQTIQQSASGVDPRTGRTITGTTAGVISGKYLGIIQQRLRNAQQGPVEALLPVYDGQGQIIAYERHMKPQALAALERDTHMGEMLGAWAGRQAEEELAQEFNRKLVDNLKAIWERDKGTRAEEFVDLSDSEDKIHADSWGMVPNDLKAYIQEVFGEDGFMIRKDMINNAVGYRAASITDPWTGISRMDEEHQKGFIKVATAVLGKDAFTKLATAEKAIQAGVSVVKSTIVIRSVVVPLANLGSNFLQLALNGVSIRDMVSGYQTKLLEITKYQKNLKRAIDIKAEMTALRNDRDAVRKLEVELRSLDDANKRMSIWPLVKAGEFATISEGLTDADAALTSGKWAEYIQNLMDKIPAKAGTIGRYAFITRDTALFQGMSRAMQYGDFLAKAVLYDHLVKQGKSEEEGIRGITEEFVNYNLLPGRTRNYTEAMGLAWFWAFKIRSTKVALNHIRNHPFRALMLSVGNPLMPEVPGLTLGSPLEDNMLGAIADGRFGYSVGPGMAFNAPSLHPWVNLVN